MVTLITNHTTAGLVLRAPGLAALGDPVDENRGYKALGDAMAKHNGYFSQKGFELYDTTGTTEDWSYNTAGGFGFTFEIYCGAPNYETGDCDDPAFHPLHETMVKEWTGENPQADHENDPGPDAGFDGQGNREAYYIAAESTLDEERHSVLEGSGPAGARLRLTKTFKTETFPQPPDEQPILFDDKLETVYDIGSDGRVRWHVNPSTRPLVAKETGVPDPGEPSPPETRSGSPAGNDDDPGSDGAAPAGDPVDGANSNDPAHYNDHPITIPSDGDNATMNVRVSWASLASDWDVKLFEDTNGDGKSQNDEPVVEHEPDGAEQHRGGLGLRATAAACGQEVRAAGEQLRRGRAVRGRDHLLGAAAVQARAGGELHAHLRGRRAGARHPAGPGRSRRDQAARPARLRAHSA